MPDLLGVPLALPTFVESLRPHQAEAVTGIVEAFRDRKVVIVDAPTGAGKSLIGEVTRQMMRSREVTERPLAQCLYVCTTKSLQEQILHDFKHAKVIKGRANYPTYDDPRAFALTGARHLDASHCTKVSFEYGDLPICDQCEYADPDLNADGFGGHDDDKKLLHCHHCHPWQLCPYEQAKKAALSAPLAVANTAYFLTEANYVGRFGADTDGKPAFPFIVVDEADGLESVLMSFVEVAFSKQAIAEFNLGYPDRKTVSEAWLAWTVQTGKKLWEKLEEARASIRGSSEPPLAIRRRIERIDGYIGKLAYVENALRLEPENWVYDPGRDGVVLKPIRVASHANDILWKHGRKFLLMSATVISPHQLASDLGLQDHEWAFVEVDSNFPPERRPIYVSSRANMTNKTKLTDWPRMVKAVEEKLDAHVNERVLIHTVSYEWTKYLYDGLYRTKHGSRLLTYSDGRERDDILETYKQHPDAVLLAPSFDRGIDLPDDLCRAIIITKVPFPNLGDAQIKARFYGTGQSGKAWYATEAIRSIVQMTGRGMRHKDDFCVTYILDAQFQSNLWANNISRNRLPRWWVRALHWEAPKRRV